MPPAPPLGIPPKPARPTAYTGPEVGSTDGQLKHTAAIGVPTTGMMVPSAGTRSFGTYGQSTYSVASTKSVRFPREDAATCAAGNAKSYMSFTLLPKRVVNTQSAPAGTAKKLKIEVKAVPWSTSTAFDKPAGAANAWNFQPAAATSPNANYLNRNA